eukprot:2073423-Amphidinium_carterae.1
MSVSDIDIFFSIVAGKTPKSCRLAGSRELGSSEEAPRSCASGKLSQVCQRSRDSHSIIVLQFLRQLHQLLSPRQAAAFMNGIRGHVQ